MWRLPLDAYISAAKIVILANMPGVKSEHVGITIEGDTLTIKGVGPAPIWNVEHVLLECTYGKFEDGLLTLFAPEAEAVKPKMILVMSK